MCNPRTLGVLSPVLDEQSAYVLRELSRLALRLYTISVDDGDLDARWLFIHRVPRLQLFNYVLKLDPPEGVESNEHVFEQFLDETCPFLGSTPTSPEGSDGEWSQERAEELSRELDGALNEEVEEAEEVEEMEEQEREQATGPIHPQPLTIGFITEIFSPSSYSELFSYDNARYTLDDVHKALVDVAEQDGLFAGAWTTLALQLTGKQSVSELEGSCEELSEVVRARQGDFKVTRWAERVWDYWDSYEADCRRQWMHQAIAEGLVVPGPHITEDQPWVAQERREREELRAELKSLWWRFQVMMVVGFMCLAAYLVRWDGRVDEMY